MVVSLSFPRSKTSIMVQRERPHQKQKVTGQMGHRRKMSIFKEARLLTKEDIAVGQSGRRTRPASHDPMHCLPCTSASESNVSEQYSFPFLAMLLSKHLLFS